MIVEVVFWNVTNLMCYVNTDIDSSTMKIEIGCVSAYRWQVSIRIYGVTSERLSFTQETLGLCSVLVTQSFAGMLVGSVKLLTLDCSDYTLTI